MADRRANNGDNSEWYQSLKRFAYYGLLVYFTMKFFFQPKESKSSSQILSQKNKITPDFARYLSESKMKKENKNVNQLYSVLGIEDPMSNLKFLPIFPTVDTEGNQLGPHSAIELLDSNNLTLSVYLTNKMDFNLCKDRSMMIWQVNNIDISKDFEFSPSESVTIPISSHLLNNGTMWAHILLGNVKNMNGICSKNFSRILSDFDEVNYDFAYTRFSLVRYRSRISEKHKKKILFQTQDVNDSSTSFNSIGAKNSASSFSSTATISSSSSSSDSIASYWIPTLHLNLVVNIPEFPRNQIPPEVAHHFRFYSNGYYQPLLSHNTFWVLSSDWIEINQTVTYLPLEMSFSTAQFWLWNIQKVFETSLRTSMGQGHGSESEGDRILESLKNNNPYILLLTLIVTLLHSLFDILAFKNDIQFWTQKKSLQGMSVHGLVSNCFFQTVIFLYLLDNDTSRTILISSGVGLLIEYWKLSKAIKVVVVWKSTMIPHDSSIIPTNNGDSNNHITSSNNNNDGNSMTTKSGWPSLTLKYADSYANESSTQAYDTYATRHLWLVIFPVTIGYSIYSLTHLMHKSLYSWALQSLVGFVYAFGFVLMTPQLFINYQLKSVAHMPWKAMVYKSLNTFIDDLFAFVIKMPLLHRIACFRDDIIFFIYLYQRWIYRVDPNRINEFGQQCEPDSDSSDTPCSSASSTTAELTGVPPLSEDDSNSQAPLCSENHNDSRDEL